MPKFSFAAAPTLKPTDEQAAIIAAARSGDDLVVIAKAGSGKTSTQRMISRAMPSRRGTYIAYNRAIADDARGSFPANTLCATAHSLAFRAVGFNYQHRLTGERVPARRVAEILGVRGFTLESDDGSPETPMLPKHIAILVNDTIQNFCWSADEIVMAKHVPFEPKLSRKQNKTVAEAVVPYARAAWEDLTRRDGGRLKFSHDVYLKLYQLSDPQLPSDFILLDESQDANPSIAAIVKAQRNAQKILVGDPAQQIYEWRHAVDAMDGFPGRRLELSQSFRFGQAIADEANLWLDQLGYSHMTGNSKIDSAVGPLERSKAVLCRTNAEAVSQVMWAQSNNVKAALVGGGRELLALARAAMDLKHGLPTDHRELMLFRSWVEVQEFAHSESAGSDLKVFVNLVDAHGPEAIIQAVDSLYEEPDAELIISTAHKAKGQEWESVRVAPDFELSNKPDRQFADGELRLAYVTVTRAKQQLDPGGLSWIHGHE